MPIPATSHHRVFLSYSRWDEAVADSVYSWLREPADDSMTGDIFFAKKEWLPTDQSTRDLMKGLWDGHDRQRLNGRHAGWLLSNLVGSRCCVALVSRRYIESPWCNLELHAAGNLARQSAERSLVIIPLDDSIADLPSDLDYVKVDLREQSERETRARIPRREPPTSTGQEDRLVRPFHELPIELLWWTEPSRRGRKRPFQA